ncbi:MAG TPA: diguanylate cyclase [Bryobacteraceae bacterium]
MLISIKRFLDQRRGADGGEPDLIGALRQMGRLLLDGMATQIVGGRDADLQVLRRTLKGLVRQMDAPLSPLGVLGVSSDAVEALEAYFGLTTAYLNEGNEQIRSMISMLTETVADLSGQTDASVTRLQEIEKQVEQATGLEDTRALRASLKNCLLAVREAAAHQRSSSASTVERLQHQIGKAQQQTVIEPRQKGFTHEDIDLVPEEWKGPAESAWNSYVAAFKLQRAEHIANRFGDNAKQQMLSLIGTQLKSVLGPGDRLLRWKGTSFVVFLNTTEPPREVRRRLSDTVAAIVQQHIEVGRKSALLSVGVDWIMFPQSQCPSLDAVFTEVDGFLSNPRPGLATGAQAES